MRKKIAVVVADLKEISHDVLCLLEAHAVPVFEVGIRCCHKQTVDDVFRDYDEVWNIGSVGSVLPLFSVFWVRGLTDVHSHDEKLFDVLTVSDFVTRVPYGSMSVDMELGVLLDKAKETGKSLSSLKFVSDNFNLDGEKDWHESITSTAFIVGEPIKFLLRTRLEKLWKKEI